MMTRSEIQAEASRRLSLMTEKEKWDIWGFSDEENKLIDKAMDIGIDQLEEKEKDKFRPLVFEHVLRMTPGGIIRGGKDHELKERFGLTREAIANGAENPYKNRNRRMLRFALICGAVAVPILIAIYAFNIRGILQTVLSVVGFAALMNAGVALLTVLCYGLREQHEYKVYQEKLIRGEFDEELIRAEIMKQLYEERIAKWHK